MLAGAVRFSDKSHWLPRARAFEAAWAQRYETRRLPSARRAVSRRVARARRFESQRSSATGLSPVRHAFWRTRYWNWRPTPIMRRIRVPYESLEEWLWVTPGSEPEHCHSLSPGIKDFGVTRRGNSKGARSAQPPHQSRLNAP
jgi:hypothetical protein